MYIWAFFKKIEETFHHMQCKIWIHEIDMFFSVVLLSTARLNILHCPFTVYKTIQQS